MADAADNESGAASDEAAHRTAAASHLIGVALAAISAIAFSLRAIFVKLAYEDMSDPVTLLALRMLFSLPFFVAALAWHHRSASAQRPIAPRDALALAALGFVGYYRSARWCCRCASTSLPSQWRSSAPSRRCS